MRLIDADEILKAIDGRGGCDAKDEWAKGFDDACNEIYEIIEDEPTVEAEPVRHGRWIKVKHRKLSKSAEKKVAFLRETYDPTTDLAAHRYQCSVCTVDSFMPDEVKDEYCKHCGCKMDGGVNDDT